MALALVLQWERSKLDEEDKPQVSLVKACFSSARIVLGGPFYQVRGLSRRQ